MTGDGARASDTDKYLASLDIAGSEISEDGILRKVATMGLFQRVKRQPTKEEVDAELDRMLEDARTRVARDRLGGMAQG